MDEILNFEKKLVNSTKLFWKKLFPQGKIWIYKDKKWNPFGNLLKPPNLKKKLMRNLLKGSVCNMKISLWRPMDTKSQANRVIWADLGDKGNHRRANMDFFRVHEQTTSLSYTRTLVSVSRGLTVYMAANCSMQSWIYFLLGWWRWIAF